MASVALRRLSLTTPSLAEKKKKKSKAAGAGGEAGADGAATAAGQGSEAAAGSAPAAAGKGGKKKEDTPSEQTTPPTVPVRLLFKSGTFPTGEFQSYKVGVAPSCAIRRYTWAMASSLPHCKAWLCC
jgi:methionyl aminopeptidase